MTEKVITSRDVHFYEGKCWNWATSESVVKNVMIQLIVLGNSGIIENSDNKTVGDTIGEDSFVGKTSPMS